MPAGKFKVGDQVELLSGGPVMTITSLPGPYAEYFTAKWFSGKKLEEGHFESGTIKLSAPKQQNDQT
jgi:uncharacterized protein YodC (DUF2158 family)